MTRRQALLQAAFAIGSEGKEGEPLSYILISMQQGRVVEHRWPAADRPAAFGSLLKPFVALAHGLEHGSIFPEIVCSGCWKPDGHGRLGLAEAVACSCNAYFLELARQCSPAQIERTANMVGLPGPALDKREAWIGLGAGWTVAPEALLRAYGELFRRSPPDLRRGLRLSARQGTARLLGLNAFAKTGTGPCGHAPRGSGDGYVAVLFPAEDPRFSLLGSLHNRPGSNAARAAGTLIRRITPISEPHTAPAV